MKQGRKHWGTIAGFCLLAACCLAGEQAVAQKLRAQAKAPGPNMVERLQRMTPVERQRYLDRIPPDKRMELERRLRDLDRIPPDVRERLRREYDEFQQLPPERQEAVRRVLRDVNGLPPLRRGPVRSSINHLRGLDLQMRDRRMNSRQFKQRFSEEDQKLIREALEALPPLETRNAVPTEGEQKL